MLIHRRLESFPSRTVSSSPYPSYLGRTGKRHALIPVLLNHRVPRAQQRVLVLHRDPRHNLPRQRLACQLAALVLVAVTRVVVRLDTEVASSFEKGEWYDAGKVPSDRSVGLDDFLGEDGGDGRDEVLCVWFARLAGAVRAEGGRTWIHLDWE